MGKSVAERADDNRGWFLVRSPGPVGIELMTRAHNEDEAIQQTARSFLTAIPATEDEANTWFKRMARGGDR